MVDEKLKNEVIKDFKKQAEQFLQGTIDKFTHDKVEICSTGFDILLAKNSDRYKLYYCIFYKFLKQYANGDDKRYYFLIDMEEAVKAISEMEDERLKKLEKNEK